MKKIILTLITVMILVGCTVVPEDSFLTDYPSMQGMTHVYEKTSYTTALNTILDGTGVVLLAFDTNKYYCPFCVAAVPILNEAAIESGWGKIYYLDIYTMRMQNTSEYRLMLGYIDSKVDDLLMRGDDKALVVPDVYFIKDGVIVGHHIGTVYNEYENFVSELNETQANELKTIYLDLFKELE